MTRVVFQMVSGRQLYHHPSRLDRSYVMEQLLTFHRGHNTPPHVIVADLEQAVRQIPKSAHAQEAKPLTMAYEKSRRSRRKDPKPIGLLLLGVPARLGVDGLESD